MTSPHVGGRKVTTGTHLKTLLWKNWLLKKRHPFATLLEVVLPVLFIILMSGLKSLTDNVTVPTGWSDAGNGEAFSLTSLDGDFGTWNLKLKVGGTSSQRKYLATESSVAGLLMYLGMRTASELRNIDTVTPTQRSACQFAVAFYGRVSTDASSPNAIPTECRDLVSPYKLAIAPDTPFTRQYFFETMKLWHPLVEVSKSSVKANGSRVKVPAFEDSVVFFNDNAALETYITGPDYGLSVEHPKIHGAVVFDTYPDESAIGTVANIEYSLRFNSTQGRGGSVGDVPRTIGDPAFESPFQKTINTDYYQRYASLGFMTLQTAVTRFATCLPVWNATTKMTTGLCQHQNAVAKPNAELDAKMYQRFALDFFFRMVHPSLFPEPVAEFMNVNATEKEKLLRPLRIAPQSYFDFAVSPFPIKHFISAPFYQSVKSVFALVFILAYLYSISRILVVFIQEKETKAREYMKILGVSENAIIGAWYLTYLVIFLVGAILQALASKAGLFAASDTGIIFLFFFLFSMSVLSFGFLISTLFSRARTGAFAGMVLFFFMYFVSSAFTASSSRGAKGIACLLSPVALAFGVQTLATVESTNQGINNGNVRTVSENFTFATSLGMLFFDTVLYTLVGMYLERVIPKEYGTVEPWYFPVSPSYWRHKIVSHKVTDVSVKLEETVIEMNANVEPVGSELRAQERSGEALVIKNIQKEFHVPGGIKKAVRGVSLAMYKDQITCLLGHNGAGKTTLISMLTGVLAPTDGDAFFRGLSLRHDMHAIRQSLGLCFQYDVLYSEMTVEEHLLFFARVKGYKGKELQDVVTTKIQEVGLTEKRRVNSASLSGGMKRKLSVAIALLGDSALVFLDEPTSGMDPYSRRSTWEILVNNRQNRVMVLTTHFMDEADILGDRIAIMAEGQLRCCGSSLYLKQKYGAGYNFTVVKDAEKQGGVDDQQLQAFVTQRVPRATLLSNVGAEISFQLPLDSSGSFPSMFEDLDTNLTMLGVLSYGISVTTMEEVFIKVAEAGDEHAQHTLKKEAPAATGASALQSTGPSIQNLSGMIMFVVHLTALLTKRYRVAKRDRRVLIFSALLPVVLLAAGLGLLKSSSLTHADRKVRLTSEAFLAGTQMQVPYYCDRDDGQWCSHTMNKLYTGGRTAAFVGGTDFSSPPYTSATPSVFNISYPATEFDVNGTSGLCLRLGEKAYDRAFGSTTPQQLETDQYGAYLLHASSNESVFAYHAMVNTTTTHGAVIFKALLDEALYRFMATGADVSSTTAPAVNLTVNAFPLPYTASTQALFSSFLSFTACIFIVIAFAFFPASIVVFLVKEKQPEHNSKHQQLVSGVSLPAFWLSNYIWDMVMYAIPFLAAIGLIQLFDVSALTGNGCTICTDATYPAVVLLFVLFGFAICPFTYVLSYCFKDHANSQTYTIMVNFILGVVLMVTSFILDVIGSSHAANKVLKYFWRLSPLYCLGTGLLNQALAEMGFNIGFKKTKPSPFDLDIMGWEMLYLALDAVLYFTIAVGIDFLLSFPKIRAAVFKDPLIQDPSYNEDEDVVKEAARVHSGAAANDAVIVKNLRKVYQGNKIAVRNLSFGLPKGECFGYLGINGAGKTTTMKMLTGDILPSSGGGTLGGFDILSQQLEVRRQIGYCPQFDALFELLSVREHLELFARIKGISRASLDREVGDLMHQMNLDDFEHKLAGTLSGGNKRKLSVAIAMIGSPPIIFLDEPSTGMDPVSRRFMWNVIANISTHKKESTIILTTHSMEECEALCTRVGIMVGGRLRCLGSVQHLKHRHGNGLLVELKLEPATTEQIDARVADVFGATSLLEPEPISTDALADACARMGDAAWHSKIDSRHATGYALAAALARDGYVRKHLFCAWWLAEERFLALHAFLDKSFGAGKAQLLERQNELVRYKLVGDAHTTLKLANVFRLVEAGKTQHHVREYSVSQTTLEQIFNMFASQQSEEKGVARGIGG